jgi:hypothetical protein
MQFLRDVDADIYCLQEMYASPIDSDIPEELLYRGANQNERPCRPHLFREISEQLPGYQAFFCPSAQGYLLDGVTTEHHRVRYGIATFVRYDHPVIMNRSTFVFGEYRAREWGEPPLPRVGHAVRVHDYTTDSAIVVAHMHGLWQSGGKGDTPDRVAQGDGMNLLVSSVYPCTGERIAVCGDFNVLPDSGIFDRFREVGLRRELVREMGHTDTRTSLYQKPGRVPWADYMLVSDNAEVESFDVPAHPEVSDHRPLILNLV